MAFELVDLDRQGTRMKIIFVRHGEPDYSMLDKLENPQPLSRNQPHALSHALAINSHL